MKVSCGAVVFVSAVLAGTVLAQAQAQAPKKAPVAAAPFSWSGLYAGGSAGFSWSSSSDAGEASYTLGEDIGTHSNGWFGTEERSTKDVVAGGFQIGYNHQVGKFVFGIESDLTFLKAKKSYLASDATDLYPYPEDRPDYNYHLRETLEAKETVDWFGTIRPRLGVTPVERMLVYATGGVAFGKVAGSGGYDWHEYGYWWGGPGDHEFDRSGSFGGSDSAVRWGWAAGAGLEYAITDALTIKGEYLFVDLGSRTYTFVNPDDETESVSWKSATKLNIARVGLNYKF